MADTVAQLVSDVLEDGGFDADETKALRWLDLAHRELVVDSRCYRKTVTTVTVVDQRDYSLDEEIVEVYELTVDGITYGPAWHTDLAMQARGYLVYSDPAAGLVAAEEDTDGSPQFALIPTPDEADLEIAIRAAFQPPALISGDETTLKVPQHYCRALVDGAIALGLQRDSAREDLAAPFTARYEGGKEKLRREVMGRYKASGASTIRLRGVSA